MKSVPWRNLLAGAPENQFPVEELSRRVFVSQYYLIREFKKITDFAISIVISV